MSKKSRQKQFKQVQEAQELRGQRESPKSTPEVASSTKTGRRHKMYFTLIGLFCVSFMIFIGVSVEPRTHGQELGLKGAFNSGMLLNLVKYEEKVDYDIVWPVDDQGEFILTLVFKEGTDEELVEKLHRGSLKMAKAHVAAGSYEVIIEYR